jgi:hypothetical protein
MAELLPNLTLSATLTGINNQEINFLTPLSEGLTATLSQSLIQGTISMAVSSDLENTLTEGDDGGLFAPPPQLSSTQW